MELVLALDIVDDILIEEIVYFMWCRIESVTSFECLI